MISLSECQYSAGPCSALPIFLSSCLSLLLVWMIYTSTPRPTSAATIKAAAMPTFVPVLRPEDRPSLLEGGGVKVGLDPVDSAVVVTAFVAVMIAIDAAVDVTTPSVAVDHHVDVGYVLGDPAVETTVNCGPFRSILLLSPFVSEIRHCTGYEEGFVSRPWTMFSIAYVPEAGTGNKALVEAQGSGETCELTRIVWSIVA